LIPIPNGRRLPVALAACLFAASVPVQLAGAQTPATSANPVDQLPAPQPIAAPPGSTSRILPTPPGPQQAAPDRMVTPQRFSIEGVNAIPFDEVASLFKPLVGKPTSIAKISAIAREVTAQYKNAGYALSFCFIPEQDFRNGTVRVVAVEGYVASVKIEGDVGAAEEKLRDLASMIQQDKPLKLENFERYTQLMSQLPGLRVEASATPPTMTDGKGSLLLKVSRQAFSVSAATDVRSSKPRAVVTATLNDPIIAGGRLTASTLIGALPR